MATGDLNNNVRKLQGMLKKINYEKDADIKGLTQGQSNSFFPIYHYLFVNYSQPFSQKIMEMNIELYGKTDLRFIESMYKILRDMFHYKSPITKEQFFAGGFIEKKVIMCTDIMRLVFEKHQSLKPKQVKAFKVPGPFAYGNTKPVKSGSANSSVDSTCSSSRTDSKEKRAATKKPHVVNELRNPKNKYTASKFNVSAPHIPTNSKSHSMPSPIHKHSKDLSHSSPIVKGADKSVHYRVPHEEAAEQSLDPIDIIAMTPGASSQPGPVPRCRSVPEMVQVADSMAKNLTDRLVSVESKLSGIEHVMERLAVFEPRLNTIERSVNYLEERNAETPIFTPSQLENLLARLTILENKVAIMDSQSSRTSVPSAPSPRTEGHIGAKTGLAQGVYEGSPTTLPPHSPPVRDPSDVLSPISVMARDNVGLPGSVMSPDLSLVLRAEEEAGTRSSTPEEKTKKDASLSIHFVDTPTCNQAKRVFEMIRDTEGRLSKDENEPPADQ
ncbi:centrosomal protein of 44 kDa-like [Lineus longissimus]|uniref:centrosomal protein of 44 kDa-like n=1 Tax=Lineus longissimus TaxID=88925 RepID=UPI00315DD41A